jgi:predicted lipid-binding transport protein (Tim44 family)
MKYIIQALSIAILCAGLVADADAKRLGGAKSTGMQRQSAQPASGSAAPVPSPVAPVGAASAPAAAPVASPASSGASRWLGPLAGLAAGGLLASMFMGGGSGGGIGGILLIAGLAFGAFMLFRMVTQKKAVQSDRAAGFGDAYSGSLGQSTPTAVAAIAPVAVDRPAGRIVAPEIGSRLATGAASSAEVEAATANPRIPADFEVAPFEREARTAFIRLQAANDRRDLDDIRDFSTPEMYAELAVQLQERGDEVQRTEVVTLAVSVLEVATENNRAIASVRYSGTIREAVGALPEAFDEVWHVVKNLANPKSTWQLAGIQQLA